MFIKKKKKKNPGNKRHAAKTLKSLDYTWCIIYQVHNGAFPFIINNSPEPIRSVAGGNQHRTRLIQHSE